MIKAEVVFDGDHVLCNGYKVEIYKGECCAINAETGEVVNDNLVDLEEAIKYCMEN